MKYHKCIKNNNIKCLGREKFSVNGKMQCCKEEIADEYSIAQSVVDAIEDCHPSSQGISRVCTRISYAADAINKCCDVNRLEVLPELKRFALLVFENKERVLVEKEMLILVCSYLNVVKNWFRQSMLHEDFMTITNNCIESMKADLRTLEMALGICVLPSLLEESIDDIFF